MKVNFGNTVADYSQHRAGFPDALFRRLGERGIGLAGQAVLDLGSGTGALARPFAAAGARVVASDLSEDMLRGATAMAAQAGLNLETHCAPAEETGLPDASFDVVTAGQCWHWFDRPKAAQEVARLLRPEGRVVICHFDWLPLRGSVVLATEALIRAFNPQWALWGGTGIYPKWPEDLSDAGFRDLEIFTFDEAVAYSHEAWRGRIRASAGVGGSLPDQEVERFDGELADLLARDFPEDPQPVPHRCFALIASAPV